MRPTDLYQAGSSWLHSADARVKLVMVAALLLVLLALHNLPLLVAGTVLLILLHRMTGARLNRLLAVARTLLPVSLLMFTLRTLFYPAGEEWLQVGPVAITSLGLATGAVVALRILAMALVVLLWMYTTRSRDIVRSLQAFGLPFAWGLSFSLALRFLPAFQTSYRAIEQAQGSRGLDLTQYRGLAGLRARMPIFIAMLITTLRSSEQMAIALEARAFHSGPRGRTDLEPLTFSLQDALLFLLIVVATVLFLLARYRFGFGLHPWRPLV